METFDLCPTEKYMWCLNRTMQYGNKKERISNDRGIWCLNRTMQYGNITKSYTPNQMLKVFKSYYVVWKP